MKEIAAFRVNYTQFIDPSGAAIEDFPQSVNDPQMLVEWYKAMVLCRTFDRKAIALQRTGRISTYPSLLGQEALDVGLASAMKASDVLVPYYRSLATQILRGVTLVETLLLYGGDERGNAFRGPIEDFPTQINLSTQAPHAVGVAMAMRLRGEKRAAVCTIGDGATSKGDFYEAINLAGVWQAPVVFVVINNRWAISVPVEGQTAAKTLAQKAFAAGIPGEQVDGNDVIAVYDALTLALEKARGGGGPHVIEALTYRLGDHTTADDASRYREDLEVSEAWKADPVARLRTYLGENGKWTKEQEEQLLADVAKKIDLAVDEYLSIENPEPEEMIDYLYAELPNDLAELRASLKKA